MVPSAGGRRHAENGFRHSGRPLRPGLANRHSAGLIVCHTQNRPPHPGLAIRHTAGPFIRIRSSQLIRFNGSILLDITFIRFRFSNPDGSLVS